MSPQCASCRRDCCHDTTAQGSDTSHTVRRPCRLGVRGSGTQDPDESRWLGYRELTPDELRQLAAAIVEQVKTRGPFRSLGEFVNRRRTSSPDDTELARYGALQAALEDPDVEINSNYNSDVITEADIAGANYKFKEAALGSRFHGTPACISQADLLMPLAPIINARSDTFLIRAYGEARSPDGTKITARAWCEAVVQRFPDYLDTADPAETASADLGSKANQLFGRRFRLKTFRWLSGRLSWRWRPSAAASGSCSP